MIKARKIKLKKASATTPKPGEGNQLQMEVDEVVALMPGDTLMVKYNERQKTFTGLYILDTKQPR